MNAPGNIVDSHRSLTGTCPECQTHKVLVGCGRCISRTPTFMCYDCLKSVHNPACRVALGELCDFCPSAHPLVAGDVHDLTAKEVADNSEAYADVVWELMDEKQKIVCADIRGIIWENCLSNARTQIVPIEHVPFAHPDGTVEIVTLDCDSAMTDWGVCTKAFEAWQRRLAYYNSGAATDAELTERMKDGEAGI